MVASKVTSAVKGSMPVLLMRDAMIGPDATLGDCLGDRLAASVGVCVAAEIARPQSFFRQHAFDSCDNLARRGILPEVREHHRPRPDLADRIGNALSGD